MYTEKMKTYNFIFAENVSCNNVEFTHGRYTVFEYKYLFGWLGWLKYLVYVHCENITLMWAEIIATHPFISYKMHLTRKIIMGPFEVQLIVFSSQWITVSFADIILHYILRTYNIWKKNLQ